MEREELAGWLRLVLTPGIGNSTARRLLAAFGLPDAVFSQSPAALGQFLTEPQIRSLRAEPPALAAQLAASWHWLQEEVGPGQRRIVALGDADYPPDLLHIEDPPPVLYLTGVAPVSWPAAIAVVGSSYGGYLAAILTTLRPVKWLALRAPALYLDAGWESPKLQLHKDHDLPTYRRSLIQFADNRALQASHSFEGDVLLIESELDDIVPKTVLTSYREAAKSARSLTYRCIDGADHGLTSERDQRGYTDVLLSWLKEMIVGARKGTVVAPPVDPGHPPEMPPKAV